MLMRQTSLQIDELCGDPRILPWVTQGGKQEPGGA
jgi:hypothetical protein